MTQFSELAQLNPVSGVQMSVNAYIVRTNKTPTCVYMALLPVNGEDLGVGLKGCKVVWLQGYKVDRVVWL